MKQVIRAFCFGLVAILFSACLEEEISSIFQSSTTEEMGGSAQSSDDGGGSSEDTISNDEDGDATSNDEDEVAYDSTKSFEFRLVLSDDFKSFNDKLWTRIPKGYSNWNKYMAPDREDLSTISGTNLHLKGIKNDNKDTSDTRKYLTGGVMSYNKLAMQYGKVEISAILEDQQGAWPALWMMPESSPNGWPNDGEIDIIERLNADDFVYTTVHTRARKQGKSGTYYSTKSIKPRLEAHLYTLEWTPDKLVWYVDNSVAFTYKNNGSYDYFPFVAPFYLQMSMQLEGWAGTVNEDSLPVTMYVDYVKFYGLYQDGRSFSKFYSNGEEITEEQVKAMGASEDS